LEHHSAGTGDPTTEDLRPQRPDLTPSHVGHSPVLAVVVEDDGAAAANGQVMAQKSSQ
jgi:hypothetical protein